MENRRMKRPLFLARLFSVLLTVCAVIFIE
jgi:hypothetical protein